jgi:predicted MFS family arabinose efflux permease
MAVRSRAYAWYVLALLTGMNLFNYIDRFVIYAMYDDLRRIFGFSNAQLGAFSSAFFVVHAVLILPFGWAGDRYDRRKLVAFGVILWSLATLSAAYAVGFVTLLLAMGVIGLGEAAYGPVAYTVLCESFRPDEKSKIIGIFNLGTIAGAALGLVAGLLLGFPSAFQIVALPGLVLGVMALYLDVPPLRTNLVKKSTRLRTMFTDAVRVMNFRTLRWLLAGSILISFAAGGYISWFADFIQQNKGFTKTGAIWTLAPIVFTAGPLGVVAGGLFGDAMLRRVPYGRVLAMAVGFAMAVPSALAAIYIDHGWGFFVPAFFLMFFIPFYNGPMVAVIDDVVDDADANSAQGSWIFLLHLLGTAPSSYAVGLASDYIGLRNAMLLPTAATFLAAVFCFVGCRFVEGDMAARTKRAKQVEERHAAESGSLQPVWDS